MDKMSEQQWKRLDAVERLERGALTNREAAQVLGLSPRQVRRVRPAHLVEEVRERMGLGEPPLAAQHGTSPIFESYRAAFCIETTDPRLKSK